MRTAPREGIPKDKILTLAARPEGFGVTWRHRDDALMRRCRRLVREGKLKKGRRLPGGGSTTFHLVITPIEEAQSA